jgi:hypothetical protein
VAKQLGMDGPHRQVIVRRVVLTQSFVRAELEQKWDEGSGVTFRHGSEVPEES